MKNYFMDNKMNDVICIFNETKKQNKERLRRKKELLKKQKGRTRRKEQGKNSKQYRPHVC